MNEARDIYLPETQNRNPLSSGVLILTAQNTEDLEFFYPYYHFIEAGYRVDVATPEGGAFKAKQGLSLKSSIKLEDVQPDDYDLLYIPGGKAPAQLKTNELALALVRKFVRSKKLVAAICHGPQLLAAANLIRGKRIAGWPDISNEIIKAGAAYVNEELVCDAPFITARWPGDLPMHVKATLIALADGIPGDEALDVAA